MKRLLVATLGALALALGLAVAAPAYADQESFIVDLCSDIAAGVPETETLQTISDNTTDGVEPADAKTFYDAAAGHLC
jgi:hypothetical protein